jgi:toxin ParE1/3/4
VKPVIFHSEAEWDLHQAIIFYERERPGLGRELRQKVEATIRRIQQNPKAFPWHDDQETRKGLVQRFPYTIYFIEFDEVVWVAAVAHHRRHPQYWSGRRPE